MTWRHPIAPQRLPDVEQRLSVLERQLPKPCAVCAGRGVIVVARGGWKGKPVLQPCQECG